MKKLLLLCITATVASSCSAPDKAAKKARVQQAQARADAQQNATQAAANAQAARMLHQAQMSNRPVVGSTPANTNSLT